MGINFARKFLILIDKQNINVFEEAQQKLSTIADCIRFAVTQFNSHALYFGHGTSNAYDEAVYLVLHTLRLPLDQINPYLNSILLKHEIENIINVIKKRCLHKIPSAYITNEAFLQGYSFYIDERAIIPRSFIGEIILSNYLNPWIEHPELIHSVLDLCTGNGSLAIIAADYFYESNVIAIDIDKNALEIANINIERHNLQNRIKTIQSNLFDNLENLNIKFDLIVTNPPYVDQSRMKSLPSEYLHEPEIALAGGENGLTFIDNILANAKNYLNDFGVLVVEMGDNKKELEAAYPNIYFNWLNIRDGFVFVLSKDELDTYF